MKRYIFLTALLLGSVKAMACVEVSFDKVNCLYTDHIEEPTHFYTGVEFTKNSYKYTNDEGEKVSIKLPSTIADQDMPKWKTKFYCEGNKLVVEESLDGVIAKEYTTITKDGYTAKGHLISVDQDCSENETDAQCSKRPYKVGTYQSEEVCSIVK